MFIEELINTMEKRIKMFVQEEKIEYIFHFILGYCSSCGHFSVGDNIDKCFIDWFGKWLVEWITDNIDSEYEIKTLIWSETIKEISEEESGEINLFFSLCKKFFNDYRNKKGYFESWEE